MASLRNTRGDNVGLVQSIKDAEQAPEHVESAGEALIKELLKKQNKTETSLKEELAVTQNFVPGLGLDPIIKGGLTHALDIADVMQPATTTSADLPNQEPSIESLMKKTGLTREDLETNLSVKPDSTIAKLYKFAISNQKKSSSVNSLLSQLPDHPFNNLKLIEKEFMEKLNQEKEEEPKTKKRKHRNRKKKVKVFCGPQEKSGIDIVEEKPVSEDDEAESCSKSQLDVRRPRPSLWDVKDMKETSSKNYSCAKTKMYTIKDGKIVEAEDVR